LDIAFLSKSVEVGNTLSVGNENDYPLACRSLSDHHLTTLLSSILTIILSGKGTFSTVVIIFVIPLIAVHEGRLLMIPHQAHIVHQFMVLETEYQH
jgi:hypothetical protein